MSVKAILGVGGVLLLVFLIGWLCFTGNRIKRELEAKYPPPGQMVDIGAAQLHINCQGAASEEAPTVVMEAAEFSLSWALVLPEIAKFARVCSYDRAGLGWSDASPDPRSGANIVRELHTLLERAGEKPPYLLVGHSKGGLYARLFAGTYPHEVAGMVLVDSSHEEQENRFPPGVTELNRKGRKQMTGLLKIVRPLNSIGLVTPILRSNTDLLLGTLPEGVREMGLAVTLKDTFFRTVVAEMEALEDTFSEVRDAKITTLGEIPLIVLTAVDQFDALEGQVPAEEIAQLKGTVHELQMELAALSPNGKLVPVHASGHFIQVDQPQAVIDAIRVVFETLGQ